MPRFALPLVSALVLALAASLSPAPVQAKPAGGGVHAAPHGQPSAKKATAAKKKAPAKKGQKATKKKKKSGAGHKPKAAR